MKVINSKLAAIGLAAFVFASCSDSNSDPVNPGIISTELAKVGLTQTDAAQLAASVTNYKSTTANSARKFTRAIDANLFAGLTEMPTVPSDAEALKLNTPIDLTGGTYKTQGSDKEFDFSDKTIKNTTIFVEGGTTLKYKKSEGGNTIYVMKGAKLKFTGEGSAIAKGDKVVVVESGSFSSDNDIVIDGTLYSTRALGKVNGPADAKTPTQNITINGDVFLSGYKHKVTDPESANYGKELTEYASLRAKTLTINAGARVNTLDRVSFTNDLVLAGALHVGNTAEVANMTIKNGGKFSSDSSVKVKKALYMEDGSQMTVDYLNVTDNTYESDGTENPKKKHQTATGSATATLNGSAQIVIGDHGVINVNILNTDNSKNQIVLGGGANNVAVIKADKFVYGGSDEVQCISTPNTNNQVFLLQFTESYKNGAISDENKVDFDNLDFAASYLDYDKATNGAELEPTKNHTWKLKDEAVISANPKLDLLASLNSPSDDQSATAIVPHTNGKVYVSYHTRETTFGGNLEVAQMNGSQLQVVSNVKQNVATYDFNHLNVIDNKLYVAGSDKGGAVVGYANLTADGAIETSENGISAISISNDDKKKGDANCVTEFGGNIVVANSLGYYAVSKDLQTRANFVETPGRAKFVAANGSQLVGLNYANEIAAGDDAVNGTIQIFNSNDLSTTAKTFDVGAIAPNNGKNMVAVDSNNRIYVCKSAKGLFCYDENGTKAWEWLTPVSSSNKNNSVDKRQGYINGVAVDNNYVYVAAGAYGLVILNHKGEEVTHRSIGTNNSANYVAVKDGYIYVAYGKGRIQVFKLTDTVNK